MYTVRCVDKIVFTGSVTFVVLAIASYSADDKLIIILATYSYVYAPYYIICTYIFEIQIPKLTFLLCINTSS